ncbi:hypothetical protein [Methanobrevibacter sp.]|nr:hypothetical protein [Methanobrevibacter sp.]
MTVIDIAKWNRCDVMSENIGQLRPKKIDESVFLCKFLILLLMM